LLLLAALSVTMAYGVTLPLLPELVGRIAPDTAAQVARHTGWMTGAYTLTLFLFAPVWGELSDRIDRRAVIAVGLVGSGLALWGLDRAGSLAALYVARGAAGALAAAVLPAVLAYVVDVSMPGRRQKRFAWISSATALGFLLGPLVGNALSGMAGGASSMRAGSAMPDSPFVLVGAVCLLSAVLALGLPRTERSLKQSQARLPDGAEPRIRRSLLLTAAVVFGITIAEVGLTLLSQDSPVVNVREVAGIFALCSVVMVGVQMGAYPWLERWLGERRLVVVAFGALGAGLALLAWPVARWMPFAAFVLAAAGIGVLIPALAVRISTDAGARQGWAMGRQAAAANFGQAAGAAITGVLYAAAAPAPFLMAVFALTAGGLLAAKADVLRPPS
jgi:MFS family permease